MAHLLDLTSLEKALFELSDAFKYLNGDFARQDKGLRRHLRAGTIQAFEFTYELAVKFVRRYLEQTEASREFIHTLAFPDLIRSANEKALLLNDVAVWKQYREKRNATSHTYDEIQAEKILPIIPIFIEEVEFLLNNLRERQRESS